MQFNLTTIIIISFFILLLLPRIWGFFKNFFTWHKSKSHRRDEFAFAVLAVLAGVLSIVATGIFPNIRLIILSLFAREHGLKDPIKEITLLDYGFFFLLFLFVILVVKYFYDTWYRNRTVSTVQHKPQQHQEHINFTNSGVGSVLESSKESLAWHEQARELIILKSSRNYSFDKDEGWDAQERCWIGRHKKTGDTVVLGCWIDPPTELQLKMLVDYARRMAKKKNQLKIIVAIKSETSVERSKINGFSVLFENESHLLKNLVDFDDYITDIKDKVEKTHLTDTDSELTINDIYVPSAITIEGDSKTQHQNIEDYLQTWLQEDSSKKQIALLGEYGQGKSTASLLFTYHLLTHAPHPTRIPILIELRGKSPRNMTIKNILATWAEPYNIAPRALMKLLIAGRLLLILEGFDEMDLIGDMETRLNHFRTLWQFCDYPKSKMIITGRPNFFLDDNEMKLALGIHEPTLEHPYCQALHLSPFTVDKIEESLRATNSQTRAEIVKLAKEDNKFREIVSRPSLLYIIATLWQREKLSQYKGRMNSAWVMGLFIRHSLVRQTAKVQDRKYPDFMALNSSEREYFMLGIATYMAVNELPNQITTQQLDEAVRLLLKYIPNSASAVDTMSNEKSTPLRQRLLEDERQAIEYVKTDVRSCGLLVSDLSKSGTFMFAHKSFMEYLFATLVYNQLIKDKLQKKERDITESVWKALQIEVPNIILRSKESISFMVELLKESTLIENANDKLAERLFILIMLNNEISSDTPWQKRLRKLLLFIHRKLLLFIHIKLDEIIIGMVIIILSILLSPLIYILFQFLVQVSYAFFQFLVQVSYAFFQFLVQVIYLIVFTGAK
jgi:hypothetical protein